jgi:hypothetical protein
MNAKQGTQRRVNKFTTEQEFLCLALRQTPQTAPYKGIGSTEIKKSRQTTGTVGAYVTAAPEEVAFAD